MATEERDSTADWLVDPARRPATVRELEGRIDAAMRTAEAAEAAAAEIGAASMEAAEQARRAVELAESASAASQAAAEVAASAASAARTPPDHVDERLAAFRERADRVLVRLRRLEAPTPIS